MSHIFPSHIYALYLHMRRSNNDLAGPLCGRTITETRSITFFNHKATQSTSTVGELPPVCYLGDAKSSCFSVFTDLSVAVSCCAPCRPHETRSHNWLCMYCKKKKS